MSNQNQCVRGADVLVNAHLNRGVGFSAEARDRLGLRGLLPPAVSSAENQVARALALIDSRPDPLGKYLELDAIRAADENLFFKLLIEHTDRFMPIVYTPTVGEVCQKFSHIYRFPRGLFVSYEDRGRVE